MSEVVTEQLHIEVKARILQNVWAKYACRHCDHTGINTPMPRTTRLYFSKVFAFYKPWNLMPYVLRGLATASECLVLQ